MAGKMWKSLLPIIKSLCFYEDRRFVWAKVLQVCWHHMSWHSDTQCVFRTQAATKSFKATEESEAPQIHYTVDFELIFTIWHSETCYCRQIFTNRLPYSITHLTCVTTIYSLRSYNRGWRNVSMVKSTCSQRSPGFDCQYLHSVSKL